jgi:hypothetical protein
MSAAMKASLAKRKSTTGKKRKAQKPA